jgi:hypothetical protein
VLDRSATCSTALLTRLGEEHPLFAPTWTPSSMRATCSTTDDFGAGE